MLLTFTVECLGEVESKELIELEEDGYCARER